MKKLEEEDIGINTVLEHSKITVITQCQNVTQAAMRTV